MASSKVASLDPTDGSLRGQVETDWQASDLMSMGAAGELYIGTLGPRIALSGAH